MQPSHFEITSYRHNYAVYFTENALIDLNAQLNQGDCLIIDHNVAQIYQPSLQHLVSNYNTIYIDPKEENKSFDGIRPVLSALIEKGFKKNNRLVAIGGGITQDITAFIASILYRGVQWFFIPTNLLSQCDSCIGSKTSINFESYKNQLGGFFPPSAIFIDVSFLRSLSSKEMRSGLGEMAHYFLIDGEDAFARFEHALDDALSGSASIHTLIKESLSIKKRMIEIDEFDEGPRNIFNYGHSFGHAIESYTGYTIPHGIAVAYGMDLANAISVEKGLMNHATFQRIRNTLQKIRATSSFPDIEIPSYLAYLKKDKKNTSTQLRVILSRGIGDMFLTEITADNSLIKTIESCFENFKSETNERSND